MTATTPTMTAAVSNVVTSGIADLLLSSEAVRCCSDAGVGPCRSHLNRNGVIPTGSLVEARTSFTKVATSGPLIVSDLSAGLALLATNLPKTGAEPRKSDSSDTVRTVPAQIGSSAPLNDLDRGQDERRRVASSANRQGADDWKSRVLLPAPGKRMPTTLSPATPNRVLSRLSAEDFALLAPHLKRINLPLRKQLEIHNKQIEHVYFPESGFASVVANGTGHSIEVGLIGREGMTGLAVVMGADRTPHDTFIHGPGAGLRITAEKLRQALAKGRTLQRSCLLYAHAFGLQTTYTAIANGRSKIEERLARWLLMARDRVDR
jgi:CRP-like cAMP-binding protein